MTREEKHLWYDFLKKLPVNVYRQKVIGNYIVDFYIANPSIVIEIDGSQHGKPENILKDEERDKTLSEKGIRVLRYTNSDVNYNFEGVCKDILKKLDQI
jgi:very-short-patch-repair endonuclease